jgi:hypothetical protein
MSRFAQCAKDSFVHSLNIEKFADMLALETAPGTRATLMKLLVEQEDQLGTGLEQLEEVNSRISRGQMLINAQRALITRFNKSGKDTAEAKNLLARLMAVQLLFVSRRQQIVEKLDRNPFGGGE